LKKIALFFTMAFLFSSAAMFSFSADEHEDDLIDLYPYDQPGCITVDEPCPNTRVGSSNWTFEYYGHRYHVVSGAARYVVDFEDENSDGLISADEMTQMEWNAFASMIINDTVEEVTLSTQNARTDLTSVVHRMYAHFDEDGTLQMFEDHIQNYYITLDGDFYRFATEDEIAAYDAAEDPEVDTPDTLNTHIRIALDDTNDNGYVIEPLNYLQWRKAGTSADDPEEEWSDIIDGNPEYVTIPSGWTIVSFGTLDRNNTNEATTEYIYELPYTMIEDGVEPFESHYEDQAPVFSGITGLDDDPNVDGVNVVVEYNDTFELDLSEVEVTWLEMFDEDGQITNEVQTLDYELVVSTHNGEVLETIDYTYADGAYTASDSLEAIDTSDFGAGYVLTFNAVSPTGLETSNTAEIAIGVMPPRFVGVEDRYVNEGKYVDLLEGIVADDGYGNDKIDTVNVTMPDNLNIYSPLPGTYDITLDFTHNVYIEGEPFYITVEEEVEGELEDVEYSFDGATGLNSESNINTYVNLQVWTEVENFRDAGSAWGSVMVVVDENGQVREKYDRYTWNYLNEDNPTNDNAFVGDANHFADWQANVELAEGEFIVAGHGSVATAPIRYIEYGDKLELTLGVLTIDEDLEATSSYTLTVDDVTAPVVLAANNNFKMYAGQYANPTEAILGNVVAFDNYDTSSQLATYVSDNGGLDVNTAGTYTVTVASEDRAGNVSSTTFNIEVLPHVASAQDLEDRISETEEFAQSTVDTAVDELPEDQHTSIGIVILISVLAGGLAFGGAVILMIKKPF